jgi:hypothetical protein
MLYVVSCNEEATQHCEEVRCLATAVYATFMLHCLTVNDMCINNYSRHCAAGRCTIDTWAFSVFLQCPQGGWNSSNTKRQRRPCCGLRTGQQHAAGGGGRVWLGAFQWSRWTGKQQTHPVPPSTDAAGELETHALPGSSSYHVPPAALQRIMPMLPLPQLLQGCPQVLRYSAACCCRAG